MSTSRALRFLIIEDDIVDRKLLERLLAQSSLEVAEIQCADRLETALALLRESAFDVVLLDLGLPDSCGTESVTALQAYVPHVPIIVLSGLDDENTATRAVQKGVQDYLVKGEFDSSLLMRSIRYAVHRKRAECQLQVAEQRYRMIFENSAVAIMMVDEHEQLVSWNTFTEHLLGMTRGDLFGRHIKSLYPESQWERIRAVSVRRKGMQHHIETQMFRKDGAVIDVDVSLSVLQDSEGTVTGSIGVVRDITERKRMEEALRRSEQRFRQVVANAKEWIWEIDADGCYTYASPVVERILGYTPEEVLGRKHYYDFFHPEDADQLKATAAEIFRRKDVFSEFQIRSLHKDGRVVCLLRSGVPILDEHQNLLGYRGADVDITDRMRTHDILDRKQKNLEAIFDAAPVGMLLVDERLVVVRANETVRQMSGNGYEEIIGHGPCEALDCMRTAGCSGTQHGGSRCDGCRLEETIQSTFASGAPVHGVEIRPVLSDIGEESRPWLSVSVEPVNVDGGRHVVVALNDITGRKRAEEELKETMEIKSQFISTVSHELRTPLTSMKEAVIIVLDGVAGRINKDQRRFLDIAKRNIGRLSRLIDDVLDFQKLNAGRMKFDLRENDVRKTVEEAYATMRPYALKEGVNISIDIAPALPRIVFDGDRIIQALTNLVSNAIKFTPRGGEVSIAVLRREDYLVMRVSDTGLGIPKASLARIFERFYRVQRPGKEIKGTGLGLAIVNKIVVGHSGRIDVESELGAGTTFTVQLPLTAAPMPDGPSRETDEQVERTLLAE